MSETVVSASKRDFVQRTIVKNTTTGTVGVVIDDLPRPLDVCRPEEVLVVYEGVSSGQGTDYHELEIVGHEEAVADLKRCGAGRGAECCRFLTVGARGPGCERFGELRNTIIFRNNMGAQRDPVEMFPKCQLPE